jgi:hypothetical protein|tara:strand:- start:920 stop:1405 length:486 start_codon:yes stop_codon:yes gene_type:complete
MKLNDNLKKPLAYPYARPRHHTITYRKLKASSSLPICLLDDLGECTIILELKPRAEHFLTNQMFLKGRSVRPRVILEGYNSSYGEFFLLTPYTIFDSFNASIDKSKQQPLGVDLFKYPYYELKLKLTKRTLTSTILRKWATHQEYARYKIEQNYIYERSIV